MQVPVPADVITWRLLVTALFSALAYVVRVLYLSFMKRIARMERKINGIITHLIKHGDAGDRTELMELFQEDQDAPTISR